MLAVPDTGKSEGPAEAEPELDDPDSMCALVPSAVPTGLPDPLRLLARLGIRSAPALSLLLDKADTVVSARFC
jgi:hypothetical protein